MLNTAELDQIRRVVREELAEHREHLGRAVEALKKEIRHMSEVATQLEEAVEGLEAEDSALAGAIAAIAPEFSTLDGELEALLTKLNEAESGEVTITKAEGEALAERVSAVGTKIAEAGAVVQQAVADAKAGDPAAGSEPGPSE